MSQKKRGAFDNLYVGVKKQIIVGVLRLSVQTIDLIWPGLHDSRLPLASDWFRQNHVVFVAVTRADFVIQ